MRNLKKICVIVMLIMTLILMINQKSFANDSSLEEWKFIVKGKDSYSENDTFDNITLAETCNEETLVNGKIAPGTSGSFSIVIETDELGAEYDIVFDEFSSNFPKNLKFFVDGENYDITTGFHNKLESEGSATHTVDWAWEYIDEDEYEASDSSEISFRNLVKAEQVNERNKAEEVIDRAVLPRTGF